MFCRACGGYINDHRITSQESQDSEGTENIH
jgi:hypothetical protein